MCMKKLFFINKTQQLIIIFTFINLPNYHFIVEVCKQHKNEKIRVCYYFKQGNKKISVTHNLDSILPNFFLRKTNIFFPFFAIKLGCSIAKGLFSYVTNIQKFSMF
jgi:hypothetical protein